MNRPSAYLRQTERLSPNAATSASSRSVIQVSAEDVQGAEGPFIPAEDGRRGTQAMAARVVKTLSLKL